MPLLGQKATNCLSTSFISFSHTTMSLSWLLSSVRVTYTCSTGTPLQPLLKHRPNAGSSWQSSMKSMGALFITHGHQHIKLESTWARQEITMTIQGPLGYTATIESQPGGMVTGGGNYNWS